MSVALATGNTVVVKPPELAPGSVVELARVLTEAGAPPGTINVCTGIGGVAGKALVQHPDVAKIDFTGGTVAGRAIGALAGAQVKHYCAEVLASPACICSTPPHALVYAQTASPAPCLCYAHTAWSE